MSLSAWQTAITTLVMAASVSDGSELDSGATAQLDLSDSERRCLARCLGSAGLRVTSTIRRSWRAASLRRTARLTLGALPEPQRTDLLDDWLNRSNIGSFYYASEAESFLGHAVRQMSGRVNLVARFELAAYRSFSAHVSTATRAAAEIRSGSTFIHHPAADLVEFWAQPTRILAAAARGEPLPLALEGCFPVLVAPGIAGLARDATETEVLIWSATAVPVRLEVLAGAYPGGDGATMELARIGAIVTV